MANKYYLLDKALKQLQKKNFVIQTGSNPIKHKLNVNQIPLFD